MSSSIPDEPSTEVSPALPSCDVGPAVDASSVPAVSLSVPDESSALSSTTGPHPPSTTITPNPTPRNGSKSDRMSHHTHFSYPTPRLAPHLSPIDDDPLADRISRPLGTRVPVPEG